MKLQKSAEKKCWLENMIFKTFEVFATGHKTFFLHYSSSSHNLPHKRSRKSQLHTVKILEPWQPHNQKDMVTV